MASQDPVTLEEVFSDEWVEKNAWMGEANEQAIKDSEPNMMSMFINFPDGVPVPKLRKEWDLSLIHI